MAKYENSVMGDLKEEADKILGLVDVVHLPKAKLGGVGATADCWGPLGEPIMEGDQFITFYGGPRHLCNMKVDNMTELAQTWFVPRQITGMMAKQMGYIAKGTDHMDLNKDIIHTHWQYQLIQDRWADQPKGEWSYVFKG